MLEKQKYEILPIYISKSGEWYKYTKPVNDIIPLHVGDEITELEKIENELKYPGTIKVTVIRETRCTEEAK